METRRLIYFLKLSECLSFTKASQELFISQPTLSREIKNLENELDIMLFYRDKKSIILTPEGRQLIPAVKRYLQYGDYVQQAAAKMAQGFSGVLHLGYSGMADSRVLSVILDHAHSILPEVEINLTLATHSNILLMLREGYLDTALTISPVVRNLSDIIWTPITEKRTWVVLPKGHPLSRKKSLTPQDIQDLPLIISSYSDSPYMVEMLSAIYAEYGIKINTVCCNSDPQSINYLVQTGKGMTFSLGERAVLEAQGLSVAAFSFSHPTTVVLAATKERSERPLIQSFWKLSKRAGCDYKE